ncbi:DegT/DnrJ/EryC1/StrS family aminotransferase [Accumulibacter sp.]|uniref:DegT/DnrJ/EryC1/StrS family aminotransferase n=1 Tax=Accumulibacter sp. TaxID=2053492 RepID=UPI0025DBD4F1|nr:DegT/DnrJ/EryC1/StrS family aminotransferase [Accumulibacter sp.]MCM8624876.1 DegT/DnrJ/EryC1/StrS family aminotransferase [Accumulibacter sp.]
MIAVNEPLLDGNEKKYLIECIESGWISSEGPFVKEFEEKFAARVGRKHGVAVCNGTAALDAAVEALGIGVGDEVIMPSFTIISCVQQIVRSGAIPVLVDSHPVTWNMDITQIEAKITRRTKAIMVVHIYGLPVDIDPVLEVARQYGIKVIEDAAQMIGQTYNGKPCGTFGDISTFSFYPNKHITTGEGGMIVTNDDHLAGICRDLRNLCFQPTKRFVHEGLGWNLRLTNLQAALGLAQLERLDEFVARKRRMGERYNELLAGVEGLQLPQDRVGYAENIYWVYGLVLADNVGFSAEEAMRRLAAEGVGCRPFFCPMHQQPVLKRRGLFAGESYPVAERMYRQGFYVPSGLAISEVQIADVSNAVKRILQ